MDDFLVWKYSESVEKLGCQRSFKLTWDWNNFILSISQSWHVDDFEEENEMEKESICLPGLFHFMIKKKFSLYIFQANGILIIPKCFIFVFLIFISGRVGLLNFILIDFILIDVGGKKSYILDVPLFFFF